ncbi:hypothetical protein GQR58_003591 [Nymphon striatum]|nr:hypothetical protein GQR58_003591 [Nymphon striatum]
MCFYLEANDEEPLTISDLGNKMKEFLTDKESTPYGNPYLKQKLMEHYGDSIYIAEGEGVHDIVTVREKTSQILRSYFKSHGKEEDEEAQKRAIIKAAARLIRSDIKSNVPSTSDEYPSIEMLKVESAQFTVILMVRTRYSDTVCFNRENTMKRAEETIPIIKVTAPSYQAIPQSVEQNDETFQSKRALVTAHHVDFDNNNETQGLLVSGREDKISTISEQGSVLPENTKRSKWMKGLNYFKIMFLTGVITFGIARVRVYSTESSASLLELEAMGSMIVIDQPVQRLSSLAVSSNFPALLNVSTPILGFLTVELTGSFIPSEYGPLSSHDMFVTLNIKCQGVNKSATSLSDFTKYPDIT